MSFDARYKKALNEVRGDSPSREEIADTVSRFAPAGRVRSWRWVKVGGFAAIAGIAVAVGVLAPSKADAFQRMTRALKSVRASYTKFTDANGKVTHQYWREGVKRRYGYDLADIGGPMSRGYDGKNVWMIGVDGTAVVSVEQPHGFGLDSTSMDDFMRGISDPETAKEPPTTTTRTTTLNGAKVTEITVEVQQQVDRVKAVFFCRESDGLPVRMDVFKIINGKPQAHGHSVFDYPADLSNEIFEFRPPKGMRVIDERIAQRQLMDALGGKAETKSFGGISIRYLGAYRSKGGLVTILWSGGATPHVDATEAKVSDEKGREFAVNFPFQIPESEGPAMSDQPPAEPRMAPTEDPGPMKIRAYSEIAGTTLYAMEVKLDTKNPTNELNIQIPVMKKGPMRTSADDLFGFKYQSDGTQIGHVNFRSKMVDVEYMSQFTQNLDSRGLTSWSRVPRNGQVELHKKMRTRIGR